MIFAAFRPDTKARLVAEDLMVPTVQMVFRRSLQQRHARARATSAAAAHPAAFEGCRSTRAHGQPRQLDRTRRDPRRGADPRARGGPRHRGRRLFRRRASPSSCSTPPRRSRGSGARKAGRRCDARLRRGQPRRERPARSSFHWRLLQGDPAKVTIEPLDGGAPRPHHPRLARPLPDLRGEPDHRPPASTSASSPTTARTTAPRRSSAGPSRPTRPAATRPGPDGAPRIAAIDYADPAPRGGLRRPDAGAPRRLARRLSPTPPTGRCSAGPATAPGATPEELHRRRRPHPRPRGRRPPDRVPPPVAYGWAATPAGGSSSRRLCAPAPSPGEPA